MALNYGPTIVTDGLVLALDSMDPNYQILLGAVLQVIY
jgi:hypothetical protein